MASTANEGSTLWLPLTKHTDEIEGENALPSFTLSK